jgi:SprT protein
MDSSVNSDVSTKEHFLEDADLRSVSPPLPPEKGRGHKQRGSLTSDKRIRRVLTWAGNRCSMPRFARTIEVRWNYRFTNLIGKASFRKKEKTWLPLVELSAKLWNFIDEKERRESLIHEACHLFAFEKFTKRQGKIIRGHGPEWKEMMALCGYPDADIRKEAPAPTLSKMYLVFCRCRKHFITPQMMGRVKRGARLYCPECRAAVRTDPYAD